MGPPKKKPYRPHFDELKRRENYFEYRWNATDGHYYYFNPYTGETILNAELETIDRNYSMFAKPEREMDISKDAYGILLLPAVYGSRIWGRRKFYGWNGDRNAAATRIQADARGHMARQAMRRYFQERFYTIACQFSHYFYFIDSHDPSQDTTWYKPYLATPGLIQPRKPYDPTDNMPNPGDKYLYRGFWKGPYLKQSKVGKANTERAPQDAFQIVDTRRSLALRSNEEIDLDKHPLGSVQFWMDDIRLQTLQITDYTAVRASIIGNDWGRLLDFMKAHWDRVLVRIYGWHSMSKTDVPCEGKYLTAEGKEALHLCYKCLEDKEYQYSITEKCFVAAAFFNMMSVRACRMDYFDQAQVLEQGEGRQAAIDLFTAERCSLFNKYLRLIPTETIKSSIKGSKDFFEVRVPVQRSMELIESVLDILGVMAHDSEQKEPLAVNTTECIYFALKVCAENPTVTLSGLRALYNFCHRCESGQEMVLVGDTGNTLRRARHHHSADPQVAQMCRRFELALYDGAWRGNVEMLMEMEMRGEKIPSRYLKTSSFCREYPESYKFPLEVMEDERLAAVERDRLEQLEIEENEREEAERLRESSASGRGAGIRSSIRKSNADDKEWTAPPAISSDETGDVLGALEKLHQGLLNTRDDHKRRDQEMDDLQQEMRSFTDHGVEVLEVYADSKDGSGGARDNDDKDCKDAKAGKRGKVGFSPEGPLLGSPRSGRISPTRNLDDDDGSVTSELTMQDDAGHW